MPMTLAPKAEDMIREKIAAGSYETPDEVIEEALRLLDERDRKLSELRAEVAIGIAQIERGELIEYTPDLMEQLMGEADERSRLGLPVRDAVKP